MCVCVYSVLRPEGSGEVNGGAANDWAGFWAVGGDDTQRPEADERLRVGDAVAPH